MGFDLDDWIHCPICKNYRATGERTIGDRGGTESITISCDGCGNDTTIVP